MSSIEDGYCDEHAYRKQKRELGLAPAPGSVNELQLLKDENKALRAALEGWRKYFQNDAPMTADAMEEQGEMFTHCWFEMEQALSPNDEAQARRSNGVRTP